MSTVGQTIAGKYRVDRQIGAGGMGTVVAATHLQLGTPVALKFLSDKIKGSATSALRFTREARACASLRSEHICRVSDFGLHDGAPYIAMELLDGLDLARLLDTGKTELGLAVDFILQACSGLAEAHAHGIVHRDLKPGNLFLTRRPDGTPLIKVLDFGVAKIPLDDDDASLTKTSSVIGSPGYMAPEQLRSSKTVDVRADVWALGVILYELISTRHPFHATAVTEVALKIAMDEPPPLVEAPEALRAVVMRCLEKEPAERYPDVESLAAALAPFAARDRAAAIAAAKLWIENPWQRPPLPTTKPTVEAPEAATKADSPRGKREPDTTHQVGKAVIEGKPPRGSKRIAVVAGIGTLALGGLTVFALTRGGATTPADAPPVIAIVDTVLVPDATREEPQYAALEVVIRGGRDATISVDGVAWGTSAQISRPVEHGEHLVIARIGTEAYKATVRVPSVAMVLLGPEEPAKPAAKPRTWRDSFSGRGSATTKTAVDDPLAPGAKPPATKPAQPEQLELFGPGAGSAVATERARAEQMVTNATQVLRTRSLLIDDLGPPGVALQSNIKRGQAAKNWTLVLDAAGKLAALATERKIDRALISAKSARLSSKLARASTTDPLHAKLLQMRDDATAMARSDPEAANRKLTAALGLVRGISPAPSPTPKSPKSDPKLDPFASPRPIDNR